MTQDNIKRDSINGNDNNDIHNDSNPIQLPGMTNRQSSVVGNVKTARYDQRRRIKAASSKRTWIMCCLFFLVIVIISVCASTKLIIRTDPSKKIDE